MKLKVNDMVKVKIGKDKGREGKVLKIFPKTGKALVEGVNLYKKHIKKAYAADGKGGVYDIPRAILVGKVALVCPKCKKMTRVGVRIEGEQKSRFCRKCKKNI